jgi:hypothetical protein
MESGEAFRKVFHACAPAFLVYYLVPHGAWGLVPGIDGLLLPREVLLLIVLAVVLASEALRLRMGWRAFGMREYEGGKVAAHAWAGLGITIGFLFFERPLVVAAVCGMAWVDPLMGLLRKGRSDLYPILPVAAYMLVTLAALLLQGAAHPAAAVGIALAGASAAVLCESPRLDRVDDDFLLLTVPLMAMWLADALFSALGGLVFA